MFSRHFRRGQYDREHATELKVTGFLCRLCLCLRVRRVTMNDGLRRVKEKR